MPMDHFFRIVSGLFNLTETEKAEHRSLDRSIQIRRGDKAIEKLCRRAIGRLEVCSRKKGRPNRVRPALWDFAQRITA
jgi:hypothetical protein